MSTMKKLLDSKYTQAVLLGLLLLSIGFIGNYFYQRSQAATSVVSLEPEIGTITAPAVSVNDTTASGGKAISFKAPATPTPTSTPPPTGGTSFVIAAAGDIANGGSGAKATSDIIVADTSILNVLMLGDGAYPDGTTSDFNNKYDPTWGRFKAKTKPTPGNHEYHSSGAAPYYAYFGNVPQYYSFNIGNWHFVSLNSEISRDTSSTQYKWLQQDLAANVGMKCTLAFWHNPRYTAGSHSDNSGTTPFWNALMAANAELVLAGHSHIYERFAPMNSSGVVDTVKGLRSFVVGTGGVSTYNDGSTIGKREYYSLSLGVMKFTMSDTGYSWKFVNTSGATLDSGTGTCH